MTPEQQSMQARRLILEETLYSTQRELGSITRACIDHVIHKGHTMWSPRHQKVINTMDEMPDDWNDGSYSVSCAVCGKDFGWHCPKNPKGYCEYTHPSYGNCKHCCLPEERK